MKATVKANEAINSLLLKEKKSAELKPIWWD